MKDVKKLNVLFDGKTVGTLAMTAQGKIAFAYEEKWLAEGFSISPLSLPLEKKSISSKMGAF